MSEALGDGDSGGPPQHPPTAHAHRFPPPLQVRDSESGSRPGLVALGRSALNGWRNGRLAGAASEMWGAAGARKLGAATKRHTTCSKPSCRPGLPVPQAGACLLLEDGCAEHRQARRVAGFRAGMQTRPAAASEEVESDGGSRSESQEARQLGVGRVSS